MSKNKIKSVATAIVRVAALFFDARRGHFSAILFEFYGNYHYLCAYALSAGMGDNSTNSAIVRQFTAFLEAGNYRKTDERYAILNKVLEESKPFSVESLHTALKAGGFYVSKATVYNTVNLLASASIIGKIVVPFSTQVMYERLSQMQCCHVVCTECGKVKLVKDNNFAAYMNARRFAAFSTSHYALYVYGTCSTCARKLKKRQAAAQKSTSKKQQR